MIKRILRSAAVWQSVMLSGGNIFASFFSAAALILISRRYSPELFGEFTVGYSLMIIIMRIQGLGLSVAIQKIAGPYFLEKEWAKKFTTLLRVANFYNLVSIIITLSIGAIVSLPLANLLHFSSPWIIFGSFALASMTLVFETFTNALQVMHQFGRSVVMMVVQSVLKLLVALSFFFIKAENIALAFFAFYLTPLCSVVLGFTVLLPKQVKMLPITRNPQLEKQILNVMKHAAILMATAGIIDYIDVLFVKRYTTSFDTGIYGGISELASAVTLVGYSVAAVLNARVARYHQQVHLNAYLKKTSAVVLAAIVGFIAYIPLAKLSILITVGKTYLPGLPYLPVLMAAAFLVLATVPFIALFYSFESSLYFSVSGIGQLIFTFVGSVILIPQFGLWGAVWLKFADRLFLFTLTVVWAFFAYRKNFKNKTA